MNDNICNIIAIVLVIVLLCIVGFVSFGIYRNMYPAWKSKAVEGTNCTPALQYKKMVDEFGKPTYMAPKAGGFALWSKLDLAKTKTGYIWEKLMVKDDCFVHLYPEPHNDFVYGWYILHVPSEKLQALMEITDSMLFDPMKSMLMVRCSDMCSLVVGAYIALMLCEGKIEPQNAQTEYYERIVEIQKMEKVNKQEKYLEYVNILSEGIARSEAEILNEKKLTIGAK